MRNLLKVRWLSAWLLFVFAGCGPAGVPSISTSLEETTIKGTVRVRGKPVDNGSVESNVANVGRTNVTLRRAPINKDGTYVLKTLVGNNSIHVSCRELLTAKNRMFNENQFSLLAGSEENTFDIEIPPAALQQVDAEASKAKRRTR